MSGHTKGPDWSVVGPELADRLTEMKELFRFALLCTSAEIAKDGMAFIRAAEATLAKARPTPSEES